ncbi:MAG: YraN family protein [Ruminococcus sp.]|nr:YraN family protein [Ruminococcus sp.]
MSIFSPITKGSLGEDYVEKYLRKKKFRILNRNMRNKYSEIDIIAENKEYIVFVEVKSRTGEYELRPVDAVSNAKQKKIMLAAFCYIHENNISKQPRFDVAEVFLDKNTFKPYKVNYIENAFSQGGDYAVF